MICPACKNTNGLSSDTFCYKCGTRLLKDDLCECGETLYYIFKYCPKCGKAVVKSQPKVSTQGG